jgi:hypothetical protein
MHTAQVTHSHQPLAKIKTTAETTAITKAPVTVL